MAVTFFRWGVDYSASTGTAGPPIGVRYGGGGVAVYPYVLGGVTMGSPDDTGSGMAAQSAGGWSSGDDVLVAGRWRVTNSTTRRFRIDLGPLGGAGTYRLYLGVAAATYQHIRWRVTDGALGTPRIDVEATGADAAMWGNLVPASLDQVSCLNATGTGLVNVGAIDSDLTTPALPFAEVVFSSGVCEIMLGGHASAAFSTDITFVGLEKVVSGTPEPRVGFRVVSGYPTTIPSGTPITPAIVLQAIDAAAADTIDGAGDTISVTVIPGPDDATILSGGTAVQDAAGRVTFGAIVMVPVVPPTVATLGGIGSRALAAPLSGGAGPGTPAGPTAGFAWYYTTLLRYLEIL